LRKSCVHPRFDHGLRQREFFFKRVIFLPLVRILHPLCMKVFHLGHWTSFARIRASSSSCLGVFCVFLTKTLTMTTRLPVAVT